MPQSESATTLAHPAPPPDAKACFSALPLDLTRQFLPSNEMDPAQMMNEWISLSNGDDGTYSYKVYQMETRDRSNSAMSVSSKESKKSPIESLAFTMVGSWVGLFIWRSQMQTKISVQFQKYNRHGKNPRLRFFWVNPYSRTLNWAPKPPSQVKKSVVKSGTFPSSRSPRNNNHSEHH